MQIRYLVPSMEAGDGSGATVVVQLWDRPPDESLRTRIGASRGQPGPVRHLLGVLTIDLVEPDTHAAAGQGRVSNVRLELTNPADAQDLHTFPWSRVIRAATTHQQARRSNTIAQWQQAARAQAELDAHALPASRGPGRPPKSLDFYAAIADRHRELVMQGVRNPTQTIAEEMGAVRSTAASWVNRARKQNLLEPGKPGRVG